MVALAMLFSKLFTVELSLLNYEFLTSSLLTICNLSISKPYTFRPNKSYAYLLNVEPINSMFLKTFLCVKSVRIWSYSDPHFYRIFPHSETIGRIRCISLYSVRMGGNARKIQTRIRTLFMQCIKLGLMILS